MQQFGRYELIRPIASGGMATVHLGRVVGAGGFQRLVAIKVMHPHIAADPDFVNMFLDEARLAAGIRHPNVVATIDIQQSQDGLALVMEYIEGSAANILMKASLKDKVRLPMQVTLRIVLDALTGLHAAHELRGSDGRSLGLVHRDVSPQNILVGIDGVSRITDFGVARAEARISSTRGSQVKGKVPYMSPEQLRAEELDRRSDVYAIGVVLWELLTGQRLFKAPSDGALVAAVMAGPRATPGQVDPNIPSAIDAVCAQALRDSRSRFQTAAAFADALEDAAEKSGVHPASPRAVGRFVEETLRRHGLLIVPEEHGGAGSVPADFASSPHAAQPPSGVHSDPVLPPAGFEDDQAPTVARDVSSGVGSLINAMPVSTGTGASAVGPVATPTAPRRASAIGVGAAVGGGLFLLILASIAVWAVVRRQPAIPEPAAAAPAAVATPSPAPEPTAEPTPEESAEPMVAPEDSAAPLATAPDAAAEAPATTKQTTAANKPTWTRKPPAPRPPTAKPTPKPKSGGEFEPDRL